MNGAMLAGVLAMSCMMLVGATVNEVARTSVRARAGAATGAGAARFDRSWPLLAERLRRGRWQAGVGVLASIVLGGSLARLPGAIVGAGGGLALPMVFRRRRAERARALVEEQLTEAVSAMAAGLRAGLSLEQSLRYAADEGEPPLSKELREIVDHSGMGIPFGTAIDTWSLRHESPDVRLMAGVLGLHRRSGGDLPSVLDRLADTLRERRAAAREVRSLTAQARMSGAILGLLPIAFFAFLAVTSRADMEAALRSSAGLTAIIAGLVMQGLAFVWIRRLLSVS